MILRTKDGQHWRSFSADKGETWSAPEKTGLTGTSSASHLLCTRDGTLVRTSRDEGVTWSEPTILADRPAKVGGWSICYPTQIKNSTNELYGDIHAARIVLKT